MTDNQDQTQAPDSQEITAQDVTATSAPTQPAPTQPANAQETAAQETTAQDVAATPKADQAQADQAQTDQAQAVQAQAAVPAQEPSPANTTDELPKPPAIGPVEVIEPEAHRVPHPPAFTHHPAHEHHDSVIEQLSDLIADRAAAPRKGSYTNALLADPIKAQRKMMEEAFETCLELHTPTALVDHEALAAEAADLVFHMLVALRTQGLGWAEVEAKLVDRLGKPARHSTYSQ